MKKLALLLILQLVVFSNTTSAQTTEVSGTYSLATEAINSDLKRTLTLNSDGTFLFHNYEYHERGIPKEKNSYAKGTWKIDKKIISFSTTSTDFDDKFTLDFKNTKARFITKSPRDKSNRDIKTSLRFYETEVFWIQGMTMVKDENITSIVKKDDCCESILEVHSFLNGKWKKNNENDKEYHYIFKDEKGVFISYKKNSKGILEDTNKNIVTVKILKTDKGFIIEHNFDGLKINSTIKRLDNSKLILVRRDGKESIMSRIKD